MRMRKHSEWMKWLTADEAVELYVLVTKPMPVNRERERKLAINKLRQTACHRRKRNSRRFAIYMQAMEG